MTVLLGMLVIDRPHTTEQCIQQIIKHTDLEKVSWVVIDNNSNQETKDVLDKYAYLFSNVIHNPFNVGTAFGVNQYLQFREPGQHVLNCNVDAHIIVDNWLELMMMVIEHPELGTVSGRRPTFWIDDGDHFTAMKDYLMPGRLAGIWLEWLTTNQIIFPWTMIKGSVLDALGFMNEYTCMDDADFVQRVTMLSLKNIYIPQIVILQPQGEPQGHPEYTANKTIISRYDADYFTLQEHYKRGERLYCGTRFQPNTITDEDYRNRSNTNWELFKTYAKNNAGNSSN